MIITRLQGGLGNQMFQYALGRQLSKKLEVELLLDTTLYSNSGIDKYPREYGLKHFNIIEKIADTKDIARCRYPHGVIIGKILDKISYTFFRKNNIKFNPVILSSKDNSYLDGFWQSYKYFDNIRDTLLNDFSLKRPLSDNAEKIFQDIKNSHNSVSLHVRRGDYVENKKNINIYGDHCNQEYYNKAISYITDKVGANIHVFVFSDDIDWVKDNINIPYDKTYIAEHSAPDFERMILMSKCDYHIIANSTFGWWGAWLDNKESSIVISPSIWTPGIDLPIDDIIPPKWIKI